MSLDLQALLYNPLHSLLGSPASLQRADQSVVLGLTVIDKTSGVDVGDGVHAQSLLPAAVIRYSELVTNNIDPDELDTCRITFNGNTWGINSVRMRPSLYGENDGEVYLFLHDKLGALPAIFGAGFVGQGLWSASLTQSINFGANWRGGGHMDIIILPQALFRPSFVGGGALNVANPALSQYYNFPPISFNGGGKFNGIVTQAGVVDFPTFFVGGGNLAADVHLTESFANFGFVGGGAFSASLAAIPPLNIGAGAAFKGGGSLTGRIGFNFPAAMKGSGNFLAQIVQSNAWTKSIIPDVAFSASDNQNTTLNLGTADPNRWVIIGTYAATNATWPSIITVGGVSLTKICESAGTSRKSALWIGKVPSGTGAVTTNIRLSDSGRSTGLIIGGWRVIAANLNATPIESLAGTGTLNHAFGAQNGGFVFGVIGGAFSAGLTLDQSGHYSGGDGTLDDQYASAAATGSSLTVTQTGAWSWAVASFGS